MESYAEEHPVTELSEKAMDIAAIDVLTPTQAARYLSVGRATLYRYIESGQVKTLKLARKTLIRRIDLDSMFSPTSDRLSFMKKSDRRKENKSQDTDYYTSKQAAEILGLTIAGVHKIFKSNNIRCVIERGIHYYDKNQIDKIKRARDQEAHPEITQWYSTSEHIYVVQSAEALAGIDANTPCRHGAPTCLVVAFDKNNVYTYPGGKRDSGVEDASIVATHMILAAESVGVNSCWVNFFDPEKHAADLGLPENEEIGDGMRRGTGSKGFDKNDAGEKKSQT